MMGSRGQAISEIQQILALHDKDKGFKNAVKLLKQGLEERAKVEEKAAAAEAAAVMAEKKLAGKQSSLSRREKALKKREDEHKAHMDDMKKQTAAFEATREQHRTEVALAEQDLENQAKDLREREAKLATARNELLKDRQKVEKDKAWYDREIARLSKVIVPAA